MMIPDFSCPSTGAGRARGLRFVAPLAILGLLLAAANAPAQTPAVEGGVSFTNVAADDGAGVSFRHTGDTPRFAMRQAILATMPQTNALFTGETRPNYPLNVWGNPGLVLFDYDSDGDQDIYAANSSGAANALYSNQWKETGALSFIDVAVAAGADATDQESSGVCFGDIDNDGDPDLYVTGVGQPNRLFRNNGNGTFADITYAAGAQGQSRHAVSCAFGDINNDGFLDLLIGNNHTWDTRVFNWIQMRWPEFEHNTLLKNLDGFHFEDVSQAAGIENVLNMNGPGETGGSPTWGVAIVDIDLDGDADITWGDLQGANPRDESEHRGFNRVYENDGHGNFSEVTIQKGLSPLGAWLGYAYADYNCDGRLDFFVTSLGEYLGVGTRSSLFLQQPDGTFAFSGPDTATVYGWSVSAFDYDNDGDPDLIYQGGGDILNIMAADNPGALYRNEGACSGRLVYDPSAILFDHRPRQDYGVATGDLNDDGFFDTVSVSSNNIVPDANYVLFNRLVGRKGGPFDDLAFFENVLSGRLLTGFVSIANPNLELPDGTLTVEVNSGGNGNGWIKVKARGSVGTLHNGKVNRDGIGAIVKVTPQDGLTSTMPISGGSNYNSQNSLELGFGLGNAAKATVEVLWPGGVKNRLYGVTAGRSVTLPEIPCSFDGNWPSFGHYVVCVNRALRDLDRSGALGPDGTHFRIELFLSALRAYLDSH